MTKIHIAILTLCLDLLCHNVSAQANTSSNQRQVVLKKAIVDSTFVFGEWTEEGEGEVHLTYLGEVTTSRRKIFKVMNSMWTWGLSQRVTSRILIFNDNDQYVGNYYLTMTTDLPTELKDGKLIFKNTDSDCDTTLTTIIDLRQGLPKQFFKKCKGQIGEVFVFSAE